MFKTAIQQQQQHVFGARILYLQPPKYYNIGNRQAKLSIGRLFSTMSAPDENAMVDSIMSHFSTTHSIPLSRTWTSATLASMNTSRSNPTSLNATFEFRFKASDITTSVDTNATPSVCFPQNIAEKHNTKIGGAGRSGSSGNRNTAGPVIVQVVEVWDTGSSKIDTVERIEMAERGEIRRGNEIIRIVPEDDPENDNNNNNNNNNGGNRDGTQRVVTGAGVTSAKSIGPHKLLLEDAKGERAYGFEYKNVDKVDMNMFMGTKLLLRGVDVLRGLLLLEPANTTVLGGKIEEWHQAHLQNRKPKLQAELQEMKAASGQTSTTATGSNRSRR